MFPMRRHNFPTRWKMAKDMKKFTVQGFPKAIIMKELQRLPKLLFLSEKMVTQILLTRT